MARGLQKSKRMDSSHRTLPPAPASGLSKAASLVIVVWGLAEGRPFLVPICIAALLAFVMAPVQRTLHHRLRLPEFLSIALSAVVLLSPIALVIWLLVRQGQGLVEDFPALLQAGQDQFTRFTQSEWGARLGLSGNVEIASLLKKISSGAAQGITLLVGGVAALINAGSQTLLILLFSVLMLGSRRHLRRSSDRILSRFSSRRNPRFIDDVVGLIGHFLSARLLIIGIIGALSAGALAIFGVKYSVFLGALMGVMTMVPAIGFILALLPVLGVALATGHSLGSILGITASLVVFNLIEGNILTPKLVGGRLNINALASFVGLFAGGLLWGIWGMLLSVPLLGVLRIAFSATPGMEGWGELLADKPSGGTAAEIARREKVPTRHHAA